MKTITERIRQYVGIGMMSILCVCLSACSVLMPQTSIERIQIISDIDANQNTATHLDFVFVYDEKLLSLIPKTSSEWFASKNLLMSSMSQSDADVAAYNLPPGVVQQVSLPDRHKKALAVFCFASYPDQKNTLPIRLQKSAAVVVRLGNDTVQFLTR